MEEFTFEDIESRLDVSNNISKKQIKNSDLNNDEPDIVIDKTIISEIEPIPVPEPSPPTEDDTPVQQDEPFSFVVRKKQELFDDLITDEEPYKKSGASRMEPKQESKKKKKRKPSPEEETVAPITIELDKNELFEDKKQQQSFIDEYHAPDSLPISEPSRPPIVETPVQPIIQQQPVATPVPPPIVTEPVVPPVPVEQLATRDTTQRVAEEEQLSEHELVDEYKSRFRILKKSYNFVTMPPDGATLSEMKRSYERAMREIESETNTQYYHLYLVLGFFAVEYLSSNMLGVDLSGFAMDRIKRIHRYNRMLVELGERSYSAIGSNWPVEVRLCMLVLFDAIIFYVVSKVVKGNTQLIDFVMNTLAGGSSETGSSGGGLGDIVKLISGFAGSSAVAAAPSPQPTASNAQKPQQPSVAVPQSQAQPYVMKPPRFMKRD